jgi:hypothetical protein
VSQTLTPAEKRQITRRANKQKREAIAAAHRAEQAARDFEAKILELVADIRAARKDAYAVAASTQGHRRKLAGQPVVSLAAWRMFVLPPTKPPERPPPAV